MPTKGKHHHLSQHHQHHSQSHHNPPQPQPQLIVNINQSSVHSPQPYNTVVTSNTPRFVPNAVGDLLHESEFNDSSNSSSSGIAGPRSY
ncbi:unnamed protein product [Xylocopa violacea]|uniref:Uncharacterized protein n=1 Tax=Xylocopa violacea TaxID=135666 RepID=A0ABP1NWC8_XYLVO